VVSAEGERIRAAENDRPKGCPSCQTRYPADALFCSIDGAPLTTVARAAAGEGDPYLGREVLGHIEIRKLVGIGAMGRVYQAFQRGIDRDVAVKILHRELSTNEALVARFQQEARVASRLAHPNVVQVLLVGQLPDGAMYIVMEFLAGLSLQTVLAAAGGAIALPRALRITLQMCEAAGEAHARGIVHRDLKPDNVMLVHLGDEPDFVKVLDFGVARVNWGAPSMATAPGLIFGTPRYISPEGARGERVGPQGDVYSIATIAYQMLAGRTPFEADRAAALIEQRIGSEPPPLQSFARAAVPGRIAEVIMRNLSRNVADRAPEARAFGRALLEAASEPLAPKPQGLETAKWSPVEPAGLPPPDEGASAPARKPAPHRESGPLRPAEPEAGEERRPSRRAIVLLLSSAAAGGVAALVVSRAGQTRERVTASAPSSSSFDAPPVPVRLVAEPAPGPEELASARPGPDPSAARAIPVRAVLDVSNPRPGLGQPIDISGRVVGPPEVVHARWDSAQFRISGPGLVSGTDLAASNDGSGVFRSAFTFLQAGRFEVDFAAQGPVGAFHAGRTSS
jgi:serine/threonine protein kinase